MARIRSIKPAFFLNEDVASLSFEWRLLFIGIWTQADRAGRLEDRPQRLKASLFPYDSVEIEVGLERLAELGLIVRYQVGDQRLIAVPTFAKHQQPHVREADSELPPPEHVTSTVPAPGQHTRSGSGSRSGSGKGADPDPEESSMPQNAACEPTALLVFPTTGNGARQWVLTSTQRDEWASAYPTLDVMAEARKALAWVKANAGHRKTAKGMPKFLVGWFSRTVNNGQAGRSQALSAAKRAAFDAFCEIYPRKEAFEAARHVWQQLDPDDALIRRILAAVEWQRQQENWQRERGRFVPLPAKWLQEQRWTDEPSVIPRASDATIRTFHAAAEFIKS